MSRYNLHNHLLRSENCPYLLGLLAMIKCSICSYQCDNWYVSNCRLACHSNFSLGLCHLELAQRPARVAPALHIVGSGAPFGVTYWSSQDLHTTTQPRKHTDIHTESTKSILQPQLHTPPSHAVSVPIVLAHTRFEILHKRLASTASNRSNNTVVGEHMFGHVARLTLVDCI